ncbi:MAG: tetratricopeptide repeat protein [Euryarchaeota archaeon]|nr:tetratricopeptide repeat protein [Euryarchaeota archaeon]
MTAEAGVPGLTFGEWILVHLLRFARFAGEFEVPWGMTQYGIAEAVGTGQDHVSRAVRRLVNKGLLTESKNRVEGVSERRKVYFLTGEGRAAAEELARRVEESRVRLPGAGDGGAVTLREAMRLLGPQHPLVEVARAVRPGGELDREALGASRRAGGPEPQQAVPVPAGFVGRARELDTLGKWLLDRRLMVISGIAGIGKTALAARLVSRARGGRPVFWYRFHEWDTPRNLLGPLGDFLAHLGRRKLRTYLSSKPNLDLNEVRYVLQESCRNLSAVLVLDDFHKASDEFLHLLSLLLEVLERDDGVRAIITARSLRRFYDRADVLVKGLVAEMDLGGLDEESSRALLRARRIEDSQHRRAFELTGGHPLALELFTPGSGEAEQRGNISRYIEEEISARLTVPERKLLRMASVFRYPVPADALFFDPEPDHDTLQALLARSLLREVYAGVYDIHDFVREFFYTRLTPHERAALHRQAAAFYSKASQPRDVLELVHHLLGAGDHAGAAEAMLGRGEALLAAGFAGELRADLGALDLGALPATGRAEALCLKGRSDDILGDWDRALEEYREALPALPEGRRAEVHYHIGWILQKRNEWEGAAGSFRDCLEVARAAGDGRGVARAYHGLGRVLWRQGRLAEAARFCQRSIASARAAGGLAQEASAGIELGRVQAAMGDFARAERSIRRSLELLDSIGDRSESARAWNTLGWEALKPQGRLDEALEAIHRGEELALSQGNLRELGPIYHSLGEVWARKGLTEKAEEYFRRSLDLFTGQADEHGMAYGHLGLAIVHRTRRQWDRSREEFEGALSLFEKVSTPGDLSYALREFSEMWRQKGSAGRARACLERAKRIGLRLQVRESARGAGSDRPGRPRRSRRSSRSRRAAR